MNRQIAVLFCLVTLCGGCESAVQKKRVIVLGFDGLDYELTRTLMQAGRLPNFARLAKSGGFAPLTTTIPPQSPVAWSTLTTGLDPGGHGIFDFIHRDPQTMQPYLSTARTEAPDHMLKIGRWQFPLSKGRVELLRQGRPFWEALDAHGVDTTVIRMPANFPPSGHAAREISGMGTPDLLGTYGTFSFYSSEPYISKGSISGGVIYPITLQDNVVRTKVHGPPNPIVTIAEELQVDLSIYVDRERPVAKFVLGDEERILQVGEWSDWIPLEFHLGVPLPSVRGICRIYFKRSAPDIEFYVTPINIDPLAPAMPLSTPPEYAAELARTTGRFYTQGMPEETKALRQGFFTRDEFLVQARLAADENRTQYTYVLNQFRDGLLFYYFGNVDQVAHMMWRARDPGHPAYDAAVDAPYAHVIDELYVELDRIVGETLDRTGLNDTLIVLSDHGFTSWRRSFNLNTWLKEQGYLTVSNGGIDWPRTRAYGLGLNSLYINLQGRERFGPVAAANRSNLADEIATKLLQIVDPKTGHPAVTKVYRREQVYTDRRYFDRAPDLIIGYARGTRASDESALGSVPAEVFADNTDAWSGDHCMDHEAVPGVLLSNRPLRRAAPTLEHIAGAVVAEFGIDDFPARR